MTNQQRDHGAGAEGAGRPAHPVYGAQTVSGVRHTATSEQTTSRRSGDDAGSTLGDVAESGQVKDAPDAIGDARDRQVDAQLLSPLTDGDQRPHSGGIDEPNPTQIHHDGVHASSAEERVKSRFELECGRHVEVAGSSELERGVAHLRSHGHAVCGS